MRVRSGVDSLLGRALARRVGAAVRSAAMILWPLRRRSAAGAEAAHFATCYCSITMML
jgi:hypothetical protein